MRHLVESFFATVKKFRAMATRQVAITAAAASGAIAATTSLGACAILSSGDVADRPDTTASAPLTHPPHR